LNAVERSRCKRVVRLPNIVLVAVLQVFSLDQALGFSLNYVLQHAFIQAKIGNQLLELAILFFKLLELS
jgi:hypothetical protein